MNPPPLEEWDLPSDADMINWVERGFRVERLPGDKDWSVLGGWAGLHSYVVARGDTWRAAVETAMRIQP